MSKLIKWAEKYNNKKTYFVITSVYFLIHLFVALKHEHWMDEGQAWVISRNLSITQLFQILTSDGHPCLWHLFLMPFAKLGFSYYCLSFISLTIMCIAVYVFLNKSPFSIFTKIAVLFSSIFLFYNPVVCRTYSLAALLVICVSIYYKNRYNNQIVYGLLAGLLFQSHVLLFGLGLGLMVEAIIDFIINKKKTVISFVIMLISFVAAILELTPNKNHSPGVSVNLITIIKRINVETIIKGLQRFALTTWGWINGTTIFIPYGLLIALIVTLLISFSKQKAWDKNYKIVVTAILALGVFFGVVILVYSPHAQMASIFTMIILFLMWQIYENNSSYPIKVTCALILLLISFLSFIPAQSELRRDVVSNYSYSKDAAEAIVNNISDDGVVLMENQTFNSSVFSYVVSKKSNVYFYDLYNDDEYSFCEFGIPYKNIDIDSIAKVIEENNYQRNKSIILMNKKINSDKLNLIYTNEGLEDLWNESYYIYKISD